MVCAALLHADSEAGTIYTHWKRSNVQPVACPRVNGS